MRYKIVQKSKAGTTPYNKPIGCIETSNVEIEMTSLAEFLGSTAFCSMSAMTVSDDYGNVFEFRKMKN